jgi:hypothetical protein
LWLWRSQHRADLLVSALCFLSVVIIVQQRTVWGVGIAAAIALFLVSRARTRVRMFVFGFIAAWTFGFLVASNMAPNLLNELGVAASDSGTYEGRVTSWGNLIAQSVSNGTGNVAFGAPMGNGFGRFEGAGRWVTFAPHNWYLTIYLRVGVIGLSFLLLFLAIGMSSVLRGRTNMAAFAILTASITYGWSYSWLWYMCVFSGWALANRSTDPALPTQPTRRVIIAGHSNHSA